MKKLLIFGSEGRLGQYLCSELSKQYKIYGIDVVDHSQSEINYSKFSKFDDIKHIYEGNYFYAVLHCQQIKSKTFMEARLHNLELSEFQRVMKTNLELTFVSTQMYIKSVMGLKNDINGRIINFSSTYSKVSSSPTLYAGTEMGNPVHYSISKGGVDSLTKYVAAYFKEYHVLSNSISPHGIENNQGDTFKANFSNRSPIGRLSTPAEVIPAVKFLLDEQNSYTNGADIAVDGGWTAC